MDLYLYFFGFCRCFGVLLCQISGRCMISRLVLIFNSLKELLGFGMMNRWVESRLNY